MKKSYLIYAFSLIFGIAFLNQVISNSGGAPSGRTGSPIDAGTCKTSGCHDSFDLNSGNGSITIFSDIPNGIYTPGLTYTINVNLTEQGKNKFGFETSAYSPTANANVGAVTIINATETKINPGANEYVTHTSMGNSATDSKDWSFDWTAPNPGAGAVIFHVAGIIADGTGSPANDHVYTTTDTVLQGPGVSIDPIQETFAAKVYPTLAEDFVMVEMDQLNRGVLKLRITDISGQQVFNMEQEVTSSSFTNRIPVQSWASGVYLMTISHDGKVGYEKFIKK